MPPTDWMPSIGCWTMDFPERFCFSRDMLARILKCYWPKEMESESWKNPFAQTDKFPLSPVLSTRLHEQVRSHPRLTPGTLCASVQFLQSFLIRTGRVVWSNVGGVIQRARNAVRSCNDQKNSGCFCKTGSGVRTCWPDAVAGAFRTEENTVTQMGIFGFFSQYSVGRHCSSFDESTIC